jgi:hypothetical protein
MRKFKQNNFALIAILAVIFSTGCAKENSSLVKSSTPNSTVNEEMVLTPEGLMDKSKVHFIEQGFGLRVENGHIQKIETKTGRMVEDFGEMEQNTERFNLNRDPSNNITSNNNRVPEVQGWIAYTYWSNPSTSTPITSFTTDWVVPSVPSKQGSQTIFLFNGMQDGTTSTSYIVQPVLQWGPSAAGGGKYWAITNWYVTSSEAFFGSLVEVSTGTSLTGVMTETSSSGSKYSYNSSFTGYPTTAVNVSNVPQAFWAAETLESYDVTNTSTEYPPNVDLAMTSINILEGSTHPSISWTTAQATRGAAQKAEVVSNSSSDGQVDIYFRQ